MVRSTAFVCFFLYLEGVHPFTSIQHVLSSKRAGPLAASSQAYDDTCDVLILGSGPAARASAALLSSEKGGMDVLVADTNFDKEWYPNYGVWQDEWDAVVDRYKSFGVDFDGGKEGKCRDWEWEVTDCYFGGSFDIPTEERMRHDRPYCRVDKEALRESLTRPDSYRVLKARHFSKGTGLNLYSPSGSLLHDQEGTTIQLETEDDQKITIRSKLLIDCTGHETKLVIRDARDHYHPPGFQIAYGCLVEVDESDVADVTQVGPYAKEAMTLFDYRTDHFDASGDEATIKSVESAPTFMYAMPLGGNKIFFEETSLVARPAISLEACKERCDVRLKHHGIKVTKVLEEELCYIPMGGALPARGQRTMAIGGSAAMVHPATGYHICRCLMGATDMADAIIKEMSATPEPNLDKVAAAAYSALWSPESIRQRNFAVFGGEFLMKQNVVGLRGFFDGFFRLPRELWAGFLAGWKGLPNNENHESWNARMWYGLRFILLLPPQVAVDMASSIVAYMITEGAPLPQSVTPFLGEPDSFDYKVNTGNVGDVAAKAEARRMIAESRVAEEVPSAFMTESSAPAEEPEAVASAEEEPEAVVSAEEEPEAVASPEDEPEAVASPEDEPEAVASSEGNTEDAAKDKVVESGSTTISL